MKVEELDPGQFDFEPGWATRLIGRFPFVGSPLKRYSSATNRLRRSRRDRAVVAQRQEQLGRDDLTLTDDQKAMRLLAAKLEKATRLGQMIDAKLMARLASELTTDDPRRAVVENEWLFPLRQRLQDLQQQLVVNQQGIMAIDLVIRNNVELMRGVDRATNVTVSALQVASTSRWPWPISASRWRKSSPSTRRPTGSSGRPRKSSVPRAPISTRWRRVRASISTR